MSWWVAGPVADLGGLARACAPCACADDRSFVQIRDIGSGNFGVAKLCRARDSGELVAVKFIERGEKVRTPGKQLATAATLQRRGDAAAVAAHSLPPVYVPASLKHLWRFAALSQIDKNVEREIINHRMLSGHPNIVRFREVRRGGCHSRPFASLGQGAQRLGSMPYTLAGSPTGLPGSVLLRFYGCRRRRRRPCSSGHPAGLLSARSAATHH